LPSPKYADRAKMKTIIAIMMIASMCYAQRSLDRLYES
jgi:hypothetical protein